MAINEQELQQLFSSLDRDGDGKISIQEITMDHVTTGVLPRLTGTTLASILQEYDSDKDGSISFDELKKAVAQVEAEDSDSDTSNK